MKEFKGIGEFERYLARRMALVETGLHTGLDVAASIVEKTAKDEIGVYQQGAGPFDAWEELADSTEYEKARKGYPVDAPLLRDGTLRDSISRKVEGLKAVVGSTSDIMIYQELGTNRIPPRPVLGLAAFRSKEEIQKAIGQALMAVFTGKRMPKPKQT